jgi:hypothetical protein
MERFARIDLGSTQPLALSTVEFKRFERAMTRAREGFGTSNITFSRPIKSDIWPHFCISGSARA